MHNNVEIALADIVGRIGGCAANDCCADGIVSGRAVACNDWRSTAVVRGRSRSQSGSSICLIGDSVDRYADRTHD